MIPHNLPTIGLEEEEAALRVLRSKQLSQDKEVELFENEYPQHKGEMMRLISSDDSKSKTLVKEFKE